MISACFLRSPRVTAALSSSTSFIVVSDSFDAMRIADQICQVALSKVIAECAVSFPPLHGCSHCPPVWFQSERHSSYDHLSTKLSIFCAHGTDLKRESLSGETSCLFCAIHCSGNLRGAPNCSVEIQPCQRHFRGTDTCPVLRAYGKTTSYNFATWPKASIRRPKPLRTIPTFDTQSKAL